MCILFIPQIRNVDDMGSSPSEVTKSESCGPGECVSSVSLSSSGREGGLVDGATYIVSVRASNRYGESSVSGNSLPFTIGGDSNSGSLCMCVLQNCFRDHSYILYFHYIIHAQFEDMYYKILYY